MNLLAGYKRGGSPLLTFEKQPSDFEDYSIFNQSTSVGLSTRMTCDCILLNGRQHAQLRWELLVNDAGIVEFRAKYSVTVIWVTHHKRIQQDLPGVVSQIFSYLSNVIVTVKSFVAHFTNVLTHWHMLIEPCTKISHRCNGPDQNITSCITVNIDLC